MVKVIIEHVLEFHEDFVLDMINSAKAWEDLQEYEKFEDIPTKELETWIFEHDEFIKDEIYEADYTIKQILIEE